MYFTRVDFTTRIRAHWFFLAAAIVLGANFVVVKTDDWSMPRLIEAAVLFDLAVVIPALYVWCYWGKGRALILRALGLSCLGVWAAGLLIPHEHQNAVEVFRIFRNVWLGVLLVVEVKLMYMLYRAMFSSRPDAKATFDKAAAEAGLPPWMARLLELEAAFWRRIGRAIQSWVRLIRK